MNPRSLKSISNFNITFHIQQLEWLFQIKPLKFLIVMLILITCHVAFAKTIVINGKTLIDKPTVYKDVVLDLSNGFFQITNNALLQIENCIINGTISPKNSNLINLLIGSLVLKNNTVNISSVNIPKNPTNPSIFDVIIVSQGKVTIVGNRFDIDTPYTVGLFVTTGSYTTDFNISRNDIRNFHGGIFLKNSHGAYVADNTFSNVSISNIFIMEGNNGLFEKNDMFFPGNNNVGDGIDIIDSENITLNQNYISSGSCYSIVILRAKNIVINRNKIIGGITYAIIIESSLDTDSYDAYLLNIAHISNNNTHTINQNIKVINNYFSQNRYGLTASNIDGLTVENNTFIQEFANSASRKFWTNNRILLQNVTHILWRDNLYKEAFAQDFSTNDIRSSKFVEFPLYDGVDL
jgi:hypothetical protein